MNLRTDVMQAWFAGDIDDSYLTDAELEACVLTVEEGVMDLILDARAKTNPATFWAQEEGTVH